MRKHLAKLVLGAALVASVAVLPSGAQAHHCAQTNLFMFTSRSLIDAPDPVGHRNSPEVAQNNLVCQADPDDEVYDTRIIKPYANQVSGRISRACAAGATLPGTLTGMGYDNAPVTFFCSSTIDGTPGTVMDTAQMPITQGGSGTLVLTIEIPDPSGAVTLSTCYHSLDTSCPDMPLGV